MAQVYLGNAESVDRGTLDALQRLPDDFYILAEWRIPRTSRQVDFLVAHVNEPMCAVFLVEGKNDSRRLRGTADGVWEFEDPSRADTWLPYPPPNERDRNPLQQAINTANAIKDWLISMQALLADPGDSWIDPYENLTVFPRLVMPFANPLNQLQTDRFAWRYDSYDDLVNGIFGFRGRRPFHVSQGMMIRMAEQLGLRPYQTQAPAPRDTDSSVVLEIRRLASQVALLQRDVADMRRLIQTMSQAQRPAARYERPEPRPAERAAPISPREVQLRDAAFDHLVDLLEELREENISRMFPLVNEEVRQKFGELPNEDIPFERFKDFVQQAQRNGRIRLVRIGPVDHLLLADEEMQPYIDAVRRGDTLTVPEYED